MQNDPRYAPVAQALPEVLPAITRVEATRYYGMLVRHFGRASMMPVGVAEARNNKPVPVNYVSTGRRCWASTKPTRGHFTGWGRMIHDASHHVFRYRHPSARPHDGGHATLEREMAAYVMARGWLNPKPAKVTAKPAPSDKLAAIDAKLKRWQTKAKRAATAIKKLNRQRARIVRALPIAA